MRFSKFLKKLTIEVVIARNSKQGEAVENKFSRKFQENSAVVFLKKEFAEKIGFKDGDVVEVESEGRKVNLRVRYSDSAPEGGGLMPNSIYSNYLTENMKRFHASITPSDGDVTEVGDIIKEIKFGNN
jgi:formylmethanofuran dehydrogenase subunit D